MKAISTKTNRNSIGIQTQTTKIPDIKTNNEKIKKQKPIPKSNY